MSRIGRIRATSWGERCIGIAALAQTLLLVKVGTAIDAEMQVFALLIGLCLAWGSAVAASLLLLVMVVERWRAQPPSVFGTPLPWLVVGGLGLGLAVAMGALLARTFDETALMIMVVGLAAAAIAWVRRRRPARTIAITAAVLVAVVLGFEIPRESGTYSVSWEESTRTHNTSRSGGENCNGMELGDRAASIGAWAPAWQVVPELQGSFGALVNARLGVPDLADRHKPGVATLFVRGTLEYGGIGCYLPLFKNETLQGTISINTSFQLRGPAHDPYSLSCSASHQLSYSISTSTTGVASCRNVADETAGLLAQEIARAAQDIVR